jgi:hypothetical protein
MTSWAKPSIVRRLGRKNIIFQQLLRFRSVVWPVLFHLGTVKLSSSHFLRRLPPDRHPIKCARMPSSPRSHHSLESATTPTQGTDPGKVVRRKQRHPRKPTSCRPCRTSKLRCDRQLPCGACRRRDNTECCKYHTPPPATASSLSKPEATATVARQRPLPHGDSPKRLGPADAVEYESQDFTRTSWETLWQRPAQHSIPAGHTYFPFSSSQSNSTNDDLLAHLPPAECCDYLIIQYFTYTAPMFQIIHETSFQKRYNDFIQDSLRTDELSWLALLFSIFSLSVQTLEHNDPVLARIRERIPCPEDNAAIASELRQIAMVCLSRDNFMLNYRLTTLESLLILTYGISHDLGVDAAWTLLGMPLSLVHSHW